MSRRRRLAGSIFQTGIANAFVPQYARVRVSQRESSEPAPQLVDRSASPGRRAAAFSPFGCLSAFQPWAFSSLRPRDWWAGRWSQLYLYEPGSLLDNIESVGGRLQDSAELDELVQRGRGRFLRRASPANRCVLSQGDRNVGQKLPPQSD